MPDLPTLTVTTAQSTRILDAYKALYGTTTTVDTIAAYKRALAEHVRDVVLAYEARKIDEANNTAKQASLATVTSSLPDPTSFFTLP